MKSTIIRSASLGLCVSMVLTSVSQADDTEIYVGTPAPTAAADRPNILFIIDTSGSMGGTVLTQEAFDPNRTYTGACPANMIYWKSSAAGIPDPPVDKNCALRVSGTPDVTGFVTQAAFQCKTASDTIAKNGLAAPTYSAQWKPATPVANSKWKKIRRPVAADPTASTGYVECSDDSDLSKIPVAHGDGTKSYAANGTYGPFSDDEAQKITWGGTDTKGKYTFYSSNYVNWYFTLRSVTKTRLQIVQEVVQNTLDNVTDVNVGLMRFNSDGEGGAVIHEVADLATAKTTLKTQVGALTANGNTPLSETLYEAYEYWAGKQLVYGNRGAPLKSVDGSRTSAGSNTYQSPIAASCQRNYIVYLTDGEPTSDTSSNTAILNMLKAAPNNPQNACTAHSGAGATIKEGICFDDLAGYMYSNDVDSATPGLQNVITYTVGFGDTVQGVAWATDLLRSTATKGGGAFYEATDTASLTSVFTTIVSDILSANTTFTAPTVSVNAFNRTQNLNDLFVTVFGTASTYHWPGNVKKYEIQSDGVIRDQDGNPAVDTTTGFFRTGADSFWNTGTPDGANVELGGAAHKLPDPASRTVYTDIAGTDLTVSGNKVDVGNAGITADMLGGLAPVDRPALTRDLLIKWIRGADIDGSDPTAPRFSMGDPLHARPATVIYGGSAANPDLMLYATTNDGYLHAIDPDTGVELWSYIPGNLLRRMTDLYLNQEQATKRYALDGNLRILKIDINNNGAVDAGDKVYLYFGMGRGGQSYYALDITDKNKPKLAWRRGAPGEIKADGSPIDAADQLPGLGQTWSTPVPTKVKVSGTVHNVVIFGGGYDPTQDNVNDNTDDMGNRVFMLDAETGALLWHAGPSSGFGFDATADLKFPTSGNPSGPSMDHSIPADIRVLDLDSNGLADRMYAADTGGRIWRFDIINGNSGASLVTGGVFASLGHADGAGSDPLDARRFYNAPDVALVRTASQTFLNLAIGSGYRGHPLSKAIRDRFYGLRDYQPFTAKTQAQYDAFTPISESNPNLIDVTNNINPTMPPGALGWRINLDSSVGEKVLAEARTFEGKVLFTSYLPNQGARDPNANTCVGPQGKNRFYTISMIDGRPVVNREGAATLPPDSVNDRWKDLGQSGIAPEPVILFPAKKDEDGELKPCVPGDPTCEPVCKIGVEDCDLHLSNAPVKTFWKRQDTDDR